MEFRSGEKAVIDLRTGNLRAVIIAVIGSTAILYWQQSAYETRQTEHDLALSTTPAQDFFEVRHVSVPPFIQGDDPLIVYDRIIKKDFFGTWNVEVHGIATDGTEFLVCSGSGVNKYEPKETALKIGFRFSQYVGNKDCNLQPGQYVLQSNWEIRAEGYPEKQESNTSNLFKVLPKGSQLYVTPEQSILLKDGGRK